MFSPSFSLSYRLFEPSSHGLYNLKSGALDLLFKHDDVNSHEQVLPYAVKVRWEGGARRLLFLHIKTLIITLLLHSLTGAALCYTELFSLNSFLLELSINRT
jgi:hypothetical protein